MADLLEALSANGEAPLSSLEQSLGGAPAASEADLVRAGAATQSQFGRGLRSGFRTLGATGNEYLGTAAETLGLEDFAKSRFQEADEYAAEIEAGAPTIRDYRTIKGLSDAANFVAGAMGQGLATTVPALAAGSIGALKYGLRGAGPGAFAGAFVPEAGEQAMALRHDEDLKDMTAAERLSNASAKGATTAALEAIVPGGVVKRLATGGATRTAKTIAGDIAEGALKEGATEAAQTAIGQGFHNVADPTQGYDADEIINAGLTGLAAGGGLQGGSRLLETVSSDRLRQINDDFVKPTVEGVRKRFREPVPLVDPDSLPQGLDSLNGIEEIADSLKAHDDQVNEQLGEFYGRSKDDPRMSKYKDFETDPDAKRGLFNEMKRQYGETRFAKGVDDLIAGLKGEPKPDDGVKRNRQRTQKDFDIIDIVREGMDPEVAEGIGSKRLVDLAMTMKDFSRGNLSEKKFSPELYRNFGGERAIKTIKRIREVLGEDTDDAPMRADFESRKQRIGELDQIVMDHLRPELVPDKSVRKEALRVVSSRLLDYVERGAPNEQEFVEDLYSAFGDDAEAVLERLDQYRPRTTSQTFNDFENDFENDETEDDPDAYGQFEMFRPPVAEGFADERVGKPMARSTAKSVLAAMQKEYGRNMRFNARVVTRGKKRADDLVEIEAMEPHADEAGFNDAEWEAIKEKRGFSKPEEGVFTVQREGGVKNKISAHSLTVAMINRYGRPDTEQQGPNFFADMFSRGVSQMLNDSTTKGISENFVKQDGKGWTFPDELVIFRGARNKDGSPGQVYKWKDIKRTVSEMHADERKHFEGVVKRLSEMELPNQAVGAPRGHPTFNKLKKAVKDAKTKEDRDEAMNAYKTFVRNFDKDREHALEYKDEGSTDTVAEIADKQEEPEQHVDADTGLEMASKESLGKTAAKQNKPADKNLPSVSNELSAKERKSLQGRDGAFIGHELVKSLRFSRVDRGDGKASVDAQKKASDYVRRVLGEDAEVWFKTMEDAGTFAKLEGIETISIALDAIDPTSVAHHEAMHALISRLMVANKKAATDLMNVANSTTMRTRLRKLLEGEEKALAQLTDPEEALAYMYQFWAAGKLNVGPQAQTWFEKIAAFFRKVFGALAERNSGNEERVAQIFAAFHDGRLAEKSTITEVLDEVAPRSRGERLEKLTGPVGEFAAKAFFTADGRIRSMGQPALADMADKFYVGVDNDGKQPGFLQSKYVEQNKRLSKLAAALQDTTAEEQRLALESLQLGEPKGRIATAMRSLLDEAYDYMVAKGVKHTNPDGSYSALGKIRNYFPRVYDQEYMAAHRAEFVALLEKHGTPSAEAQRIAANLSKPAENTSPTEDDFHAGLTYFLPNTNERKLVDIPAEELAPYLNKNLFETMATYITRAVRRGEYAQRFGNKGEAIEKAIVDAKKQGLSKTDEMGFRKAVMAMEGSLGHEMPEGWRKAMGAMVTYQNVRLLPLALFSSLVDPIGIAVRGGGVGEAFKAFRRGFSDFARKHPDEAEQLAIELGVVEASEAANMMSDAYGSQFMTPFQRKINNTLFKYNGMESWNRSMRIQATAAARAFIVKHATKPNEHSERYLRELGLTEKDVQTAEDGSLEINEKTAQAINLWVDGAVLRPNAAIRPVWMSDPRWMLVSHLKQFTYSFQKTILARVAHEIENGNYRPLMAMASYVPFIIAADLMKVVLTPGGGDDEARKKWGAEDYLWNGVQRAGLFGPGQYALDSYGDLSRGKFGIEGAAGPTVEQLLNLGHAVATPSGDIGSWFAKAVPGHQLVK